jgi:holliday junction DNA helicase RuvA
VIASVAGRLLEADADGLVVEVGGVGLRVHASSAAVRAAREQPEAVRLHTHLVVREDALTLYGFAGGRERSLFVALLGVSGLGPSKALALLSGYPVETLQRAIATGDLALLASVSGIGKRTAERIVVELRDKLGAAALETPAADGSTAPLPGDPHLQARDALVALGFAVAEAESALSETHGSAEQRIKSALAVLRRGGSA